MRFFTLFLCLALTSTAHAQQCNCLITFDSVVSYMQKNYAGSQYKINNSTRKSYLLHTEKFRNKARQSSKESWCFYTISQWLNFFKDHHVYAYPPDNSSPANLQKTIDATEIIKPDSNRIKSLRNPKNTGNIEGIYSTSSCTVALIRSLEAFRSHAAIILQTNEPNWKPGMVRFELFHQSRNQYDGIFYDEDHFPEINSLSFTPTYNGIVDLGWEKCRIYIISNLRTPTIIPRRK